MSKKHKRQKKTNQSFWGVRLLLSERVALAIIRTILAIIIVGSQSQSTGQQQPETLHQTQEKI
jgi:hypothetical protein